MIEYPSPWTSRPTNAGTGLYDANGKTICHEWDADEKAVEYVLLCVNMHSRLMAACFPPVGENEKGESHV